MLRYVTRAILVALVPCCLPSPAAAADPPFVPVVFSPVRLAPAYQERWFEPGVCRSATFRALVADLAASDVIVYVVPRFQGTRRVAGDLQFVTGSPGSRILRVTINLRAVGHNADVAIAMLGHELRHAVEVAQAPHVRSSEAFAEFYREHGVETEWGVYDTAAARNSERDVREELLQSGRTTCEDPPDVTVADR
jgi:hypothetical protein